jgi:type IV pilus secretin PilQ/predicted competence protein
MKKLSFVYNFLLTIIFFFLLFRPLDILTAQEQNSSSGNSSQLTKESKNSDIEDKLKQVVNIDYKDADLLNVLRSLSWSYGLNIVTSPDIKGKVTITLNNVSLKDALDAILSANGFVSSLRKGVLYISKGDIEMMEKQVEVIFLKYISSSEAQSLLEKVISTKGDIQVNELANSILITDFPANIAKAKELLKKIDVPPQQVVIEAKIVDVTLNDLEAFGIQWDIDYTPNKGLFQRNTLYSEELKGTISMAEQSSDLSGGQITLNTLTLKDMAITATIDALVKNGKATILASPSITVLNGQEARIVIGERYPYKERTQTTTGTTETTKFVDIGVTLRVTPQINQDNFITMRLHPEVSSLQSSLDAGPRITTREADTTVRVKAGHTLVIAGLIKHTDDRNRERVPFLGRIPILGFFFSRSDKKIEQKELAVFITPHIVPADVKEISKAEKSDEPYLKVARLNAVERIYEKARSLEKGYGVVTNEGERRLQRIQALNFYEYIFKEFPQSVRAPESLYRAGIIAYRDMSDAQNAYRIFKKLIRQYPNSPFSLRAKPIYRKIKLSVEKLKGPRQQKIRITSLKNKEGNN